MNATIFEQINMTSASNDNGCQQAVSSTPQNWEGGDERMIDEDLRQAYVRLGVHPQRVAEYLRDKMAARQTEKPAPRYCDYAAPLAPSGKEEKQL
jgi:hypothetical protein